MAAGVKQTIRGFDPGAFGSFRFLSRELDSLGRVSLRYALDDEITFLEKFDLPVETPLDDGDRERVDALVSLLHWVAGVSYFKTALPATVAFQGGGPPPAAA